MMKKKPLYIGKLALAALQVLLIGGFTSCHSSNDYNWWDEEDSDNKEEAITVTITENDSTPTPLSTGSQLGYFALSDDGTSSENNTPITVGAEGQVSFPSTAEGKYVIYSPYQEEWENALTTPPRFKVKPDQSTEANYNASNLMVGIIDISPSTRADNNQSMSMKQMMGKLYIRIIDETGAIDFKNEGTLKLLSMKDAVTLNLSEQKVNTVEDSEENITMFAYERTDRRLTAVAIIAPQTRSAESPFIVLNVNGRQYIYRQSFTLDSGQSYAYIFRLTKNGLLLDGTYITNWESGGKDTTLPI